MDREGVVGPCPRCFRWTRMPRSPVPLSDGDAPAAARRDRPDHLRPAPIALVFLGGAAGTGAREALTLVLPQTGRLPLTILGINLIGAFLLGVLLESLARLGPDAGPRRGLRLLLGTGFLGGFTTYSALAADSALLLGQAAVGLGLAYAVGTVVLGALASLGGIAVCAAVRCTDGARAP